MNTSFLHINWRIISWWIISAWLRRYRSYTQVSSGLPVRNGNRHASEIASMALDLLRGITSFHVSLLFERLLTASVLLFFLPFFRFLVILTKAFRFVSESIPVRTINIMQWDQIFQSFLLLIGSCVAGIVGLKMPRYEYWEIFLWYGRTHFWVNQEFWIRPLKVLFIRRHRKYSKSDGISERT